MKLPDNNKGYSRVIELELTNLEPWFILKKDQIKQKKNGLKKRYPSRRLIPFAKRDDNDDVACFEEGKDEEIQIIHDFASPGFEQKKTYKNFWDWFKTAIDEMIFFE